jgi:predicted MFS family arabinose efflux permease
VTGPPKPTLFTGDFILLGVVLAFVSAMMALFFQFQSYLTSVGIDPRWHGFLLGSDAITGIVLQPLLSPYLNARNAKKVLLAGICVMAAALASYSHAVTAGAIALVRIVHGGGFVAAVAAMMALVAGYIPRSRSGEAIGIISIMRLLPYALVPPVIVHLAHGPRDFTVVLTVAAGVTALVLIPVAFMHPAREGEEGQEKSAGLSGLFENMRSVPVLTLLVVNILFYSPYTILFFFLRDFGALRGIGNPGFFFTVAMFVMIAVRLGGSRYFDRMNKARTGALCMALLAVFQVLVYFVRVEASFLGLSVVFGVLWGVGIPLIMALIFDISEPRFRGLNMNLVLVVMQVAFFVGPFAGGIVLARWGYGPLFALCGVLNMAGSILLIGLRDRKVPGPRSQVSGSKT